MSLKSRNIKLMKLSSIFSGMGFFRAVMSLYFISHGVGIEHIVFSQTFYSALTVISEVPTGLIGDKFGHRTSVLLGKVLAIVPYAMYIFMPNILGLYLSFIFFGIGDALMSGSDEAFAHDSSLVGEYKKNIASMMSNEVFGGVIGTATAGLAYWWLGNKGFTLLLTLNTLTRFLSLIVYARTKVVREGKANRSDSKMKELFTGAVRQIWHSSTLRSLTYVKMLTIAGQYVLYGIYAPYFKDNHVQPVFIGLVLTFGLLSNGLVVRYIHKLEKYFSLDTAVLLFPVLMGITYFIFSIVHNPWLLVFIFILLQAQFNVLDPVISDYINYEADPSTRATVLSGVSMISTLANTASKLVLGIVITFSGIIGMFRFQAVYLVIGGVVSWWLLKRCGCVYVLPTNKNAVE
jgi:MFS family permease